MYNYMYSGMGYYNNYYNNYYRNYNYEDAYDPNKYLQMGGVTHSRCELPVV